jgi:hypothetical protein
LKPFPFCELVWYQTLQQSDAKLKRETVVTVTGTDSTGSGTTRSRIAPEPDAPDSNRNPSSPWTSAPMADGGDMDEEAMRAFFPMSFGKAPARSNAASSAAHSSTVRKPQNPSSKPSTTAPADDDGEGAMIGPPRPPPAPAGEDDEDGGMIGPPRPPPPSAPAEGDDPGGDMIGPPRPPLAMEADEDDDDGEEEEDDDDMEDDGGFGFNRLPLSNEIVLRGHTKVTASNVLLFYLSLFASFSLNYCMMNGMSLLLAFSLIELELLNYCMMNDMAFVACFLLAELELLNHRTPD